MVDWIARARKRLEQRHELGEIHSNRSANRSFQRMMARTNAA
jgi:hypothetical protein